MFTLTRCRTTRWNHTPLHDAIRFHHSDVEKFLRDYDVMKKNELNDCESTPDTTPVGIVTTPIVTQVPISTPMSVRVKNNVEPSVQEQISKPKHEDTPKPNKQVTDSKDITTSLADIKLDIDLSKTTSGAKVGSITESHAITQKICKKTADTTNVQNNPKSSNKDNKPSQKKVGHSGDH